MAFYLKFVSGLYFAIGLICLLFFSAGVLNLPEILAGPIFVLGIGVVFVIDFIVHPIHWVNYYLTINISLGEPSHQLPHRNIVLLVLGVLALGGGLVGYKSVKWLELRQKRGLIAWGILLAFGLSIGISNFFVSKGDPNITTNLPDLSLFWVATYILGCVFVWKKGRQPSI